MNKSTYYKLSSVAFNKAFRREIDALKNAEDSVESHHIKISSGNRKLGLIPSISLLPVVDCGNCIYCASSCYDLRHDLIYKETVNARAINSAIYNKEPDRYFRQIDAWLTFNFPRAFRWHIGGDIKDITYLKGMIKIAENHKEIKFLCFTKMFDVINSFLDGGGIIPQNLQIIFSGWLGIDMSNPYNLPSAHPLFADGSTSAKDGAKLCTGNCTECLYEKKLCWNLKKGEQIIFTAH